MAFRHGGYRKALLQILRNFALGSTQDSLLNDRLTAALIGQNDDNPRKDELLFDSDSDDDTGDPYCFSGSESEDSE